jgi:hypothetical protein
LLSSWSHGDLGLGLGFGFTGQGATFGLGLGFTGAGHGATFGFFGFGEQSLGFGLGLQSLRLVPLRSQLGVVFSPASSWAPILFEGLALV